MVLREGLSEVMMAEIEKENKDNISVVIDIESFRHGKKERNELDDTKDNLVSLSPLGKIQALVKSLEIVDLDKAFARGSQKLRSRQTAALVVRGPEILNELSTRFNLSPVVLPDSLRAIAMKLSQKAEPKAELTSEEQQIVDYVNQIDLSDELGKTEDATEEKWTDQDSRLGFHDGNEPIHTELEDKADEGQLLVWMVKESDKRAVETQDTDIATYTRHAVQMADLLLSYLETSDELKRFVSHHKDQFKSVNKDGNYSFKRVFGTHTRVNESFILKTIEHLEATGRIESPVIDKILKIIPNGVAETEGPKYRIINDETGRRLEIVLPERLSSAVEGNIVIDENLLKEIIAEGKQYEKKFKSV